MNLENCTEDMTLVFCEAYVKTRLYQALLTTPITMDTCGRERLSQLVEGYLKEFEKIRKLHETHQMHITESWENKTLNGEVSCVTVVAEDDNIPNVLKFAKLWKPKESV